MKIFKLYWLEGTIEEITGDTIAEAMMRAGYGGGAIRALDYYEEIELQSRNK